MGSVGIVGKRRVEATSQDSPLANPDDGHTLGGRTEKWKDKTRAGTLNDLGTVYLGLGDYNWEASG